MDRTTHKESAQRTKQLTRTQRTLGNLHPTKKALTTGECTLLALLSYAAHDPTFASELATLGSTLPHTQYHNTPYHIGNNIGFIVPTDRETAERRATWLINGIRGGWLPGASAAGQLLTAWSIAQTEEKPRMIVIGHILGVIPPVGVGNVRRKRKLTIIADKEVAEHNPHALTTSSVRLGAEVITRAIQHFGGQINNIEPETAEWLFGERQVTLFTAHPQTITTIARDAQELGVIYAIERNHRGQIVTLALSPMVNGEYLDLHYKLRDANT